MNNLQQAAQAALEALLAADIEMANGGILACHASRKQIAAAIETLRAALAEPQPEPVAEVTEVDLHADHQGPVEAFAYLPIGTKLYAAPQAHWPWASTLTRWRRRFAGSMEPIG